MFSKMNFLFCTVLREIFIEEKGKGRELGAYRAVTVLIVVD